MVSRRLSWRLTEETDDDRPSGTCGGTGPVDRGGAHAQGGPKPADSCPALEFACILGHDLPGRAATVPDVLAATEFVQPAI
jgi:hypothetical protein